MNALVAPFEFERDLERQRLGWTLMAIVAMAAPQALHIPVWMTTCALLLGVWRAGAAWRGWHMPSGWTLKFMAFAMIVMVIAVFRTINGAEAAGALLLLLVMLKLMEARGLRDYFLVMVIAYFLGMDNFLYDQTIQLALYMVPAMGITTVALLNVAHPDPGRNLATSMRDTARFLLPAVPIAVILFLLFPRISGPLWGFGSLKKPGTTGLSSSMSPGDLSQLAQSDDVAFHVKFDGVAPPPGEMYWRALVLHDYDGTTWKAGNLPWRDKADAEAIGAPVRYHVTLEANNLQVLYTLDLPESVPDDAYLSASYETLVHGSVTERKLYDVTSYPRASYGADTPAWMLHRDLMLPKTGDPRARALAQQWLATKRSTGEIVNAALDMFHDQPFHYTLQPGQLSEHDRIDQFLFQTRRGFCEHYASAFVFLMRAAGIPAHVVIGYLGGSQNPVDEYYVIRQREAHAWAEVWTSKHGWQRVDPTGAVDPSRVEPGLDGGLADDGVTGSIYDRYPWLGAVRNSWDALDSGWNKWVLAYGPELQEKFYSKVGLEYGNWLQLALVLGGLMMALLGCYWLYLWWERRPPPLPPVSRDYARFCLRLARLGLPRAAHEGPSDYAARVVAARADLERPVLDITDSYVELRYQDSGDARAFRRMVRSFRPRKR